MIFELVEEYFSGRCGGANWAALTAEARQCAVNSAVDDITNELSFVDADNPAVVGAVAEQALFLASGGAAPGAPAPGAIVSQSVDGIGSVTYRTPRGSVLICEKAKAFIARVRGGGGLVRTARC